MKRIIAALLFLSSTSAFATCIGNGSCPTTNNDNRTYNQGGQGGNASASAGAVAGAAAIVGVENKVTNVVGVGVENKVHNVNDLSNRNSNVNVNGQDQSQKQGQGQLQGQSQNATAKQGQSQSADNKGVKQNVTVEGDTYEEKRQAPGIGVGFAPASAPCRIAGGGGLSIPGGAITFGGSIEDEECQWRENARSFAAINDNATAVEALCQIARNKVLKRCKALEPVARTVIDNEAPIREVAAVRQLRVENTGCVADPIVASRHNLVACK
jgi:hypothetical protein